MVMGKAVRAALAMSLLSDMVLRHGYASFAEDSLQWSYSNPTEFCLNVPATVCFRSANNTKEHVLTAGPLVPGLLAAWSFDDIIATDTSGNGAHIPHSIAAGPARWGTGQSAYFGARTHATVPSTPALEEPHFTLSFWLYLVEDAAQSGESGAESEGLLPSEQAQQWRTILRKGNLKTVAPGLFLWPQSRRLHVKYELRSGDRATLDSKADLPARRWHHIALVVDSKLVQLYVNGVLDAERVNSDSVVANTEPLYLGGDPWAGQPGGGDVHVCLVDDFKVWKSSDVTKSVILAEAAGALGGIATSEYRIGCIDCTIDAATAACARHEQPSYRACSLEEYRSGGFHAMKAQGWGWSKDASEQVWTSQALLDHQVAKTVHDEQLQQFATTSHLVEVAVNSTSSTSQHAELARAAAALKQQSSARKTLLCCVNDFL